jgi:transcription initiation factor TFIIIB Brf1 subunit/transcription initiation factor TFIIB
MKCPTCGTENKSTNMACLRCGCVLKDSGYQPMGDVNALWRKTPAEKKPVRTPPPFWGDTKGRPTYEDQSDFIVLHDEDSDSNAAQDLVDSGAPVPDNRQKLERAKGRREVRVIVPSAPPPRVEAPKARRYRVRWPRLVVSAVAILVLCAGVAYGGYWLYRFAVGSISQMIADNRSGDVLQDPEVKRVMIDGQTWHRIIFYGKDGEMVLVSSPKRSLKIENGKAELMLDDSSYILPDDQKSDKITVSLEAIIVATDGTERKITIEPYEIEVPLAPLKLVTPLESSVTTNADRIYIKVKVTPGSKRVLIGNQNVTDHVSKDGYASATVNVSPNTVNTIQVSVDTARYRKNVLELKVERPIMEVPIELDESTVTDSSTTDSKVVIRGSTEAGASITTTAKLSGKITKESGSTSFSFTAVLKRWGWNDIEITAEAGGRRSTMVHRIYHEPSLDSYSRDAQKVDDYSYLCSSAEVLIGRIYAVKGVVVRKLESDLSDYYVFNINTPAEPRLIVVENTKEDPLKENQYYQLFVDVTGVYESENLPILTLRFLNKLDMPAEFATQAPGATATPEQTEPASPAATE